LPKAQVQCIKSASGLLAHFGGLKTVKFKDLK
jgi:hypothetical protein